MKKTLVLLLSMVFIGGCGSNFEWFPKYGGFNNSSTATVPVTAPGTVMRTIPFPTVPDEVRFVSDIVFDKNTGTFWMLAGTSTAPLNTPNVLVRMNATTGVVDRTVNAGSWPFTIINGSTMAFDGVSFWVTSGVNDSEIYLIFSNGNFLNNNVYPCAATTTGLCRGIAWDSTTASFWSAASDISRLVNYQVINGAVTSSTPALPPYTTLWSGSDVTDVSFDSLTGQVFVIKNGVIVVQGNSGTSLGTISFTVPGTGRGDWDGQFFWVVDNTSKSIKALFVR